MEKTRAILIRRIRFSETSLICVWLSETFGKLKTSARGALKNRSAFQGKLDLFFEAEIAFARSRTAEIHTLREVALLAPFDGLATRYANLSTAAYFADLMDLVTEPMAHAEGLYDLLHRATAFLRANPATHRAIVHFESELCRALGILDERHPDPLRALASHCGRIPASRKRALETLATGVPLASGPSGTKLN